MVQLVLLFGGCSVHLSAPSGDAAKGRETPDVVARVEAFNAGLTPEARAEKYCAMAASPFTWVRGTAHLYWEDHADDPRLGTFGTGWRTWVQGDLHAANFGAFDDDRGTVVFDLNDFDEVVIADPQLDLWRLATSIELVADAAGLDGDDSEEAIDEAVDGWLDALDDFVDSNDELDLQLDEHDAWGILDEFLDDVEDDNSRREMLDDWSERDDGERFFSPAEHEDLGVVSPELEAALLAAWPDYLATLSGGLDADPDWFEIKDVALRLHAGTGSLGTPRLYVLIEGATDDRDDDRLLDIKQQGDPAAWPWLDEADRERLADLSPAERVVAGHKAMGVRVDDHLGWASFDDATWSVRERSPFKKSLDLEDELDTGTRLRKVAAQWGLLLAAAHARADDDHDEGLVDASVELQVTTDVDDKGDFRAQVREVAQELADQARTDHAVFVDYVDDEGLCP